MGVSMKNLKIKRLSLTFTLIFLVNLLAGVIPLSTKVKAVESIQDRVEIINNGNFDLTEKITDSFSVMWEQAIKPLSWDMRKYGTYTAPNGTMVSDIYHTQGKAVKVQLNNSVGFLQQVSKTVVPGRNYSFSSWVKTENLTTVNYSNKPMLVRVEQLDKAGATISSTRADLKVFSGTNDWSNVSGNITVAVNASTIKIVFVFGVVTATGGGATGTVWVDDVSLTEPVIPLTALSLNNSSLEVPIGWSETLSIAYSPSNASFKQVTWSSSDSTVAEVKDGTIKMLRAGTATITAESTIYPDIKASCTVKALEGEVPVKSIALDKNSIILQAGKAEIITAQISPAYASNKEVIWTSSDSSVANVVNGIVKSNKAGTAVITAKTADGGYIANCSVTVTAAAEDEYDKLRNKWRALTIPDANVVNSDSQIKNITALAGERGRELWDSMDKSSDRTYLWADASSTTNSAHVTTSYKNLFEMSKAFVMEGSELKDNAQLLKDIISGLKWLNVNRYKNNQRYNNWWDWEVGVPQQLNNTMVLLYEYLSDADINAYLTTIDSYVPNPTKQQNQAVTSTGANRVDLCKVVGLRGILGKNAYKVSIASESLSPVFEIVTSGDGFYKDGSFVQHNNIAYTATYGSVLVGGVGELLYLLSDSKWSVTNASLNNMYEAIIKSFYPVIYKGNFIEGVKGRAISRPEEQGSGGTVAGFMLKYFARSAPAELREKYKAIVKYWIQANNYKDMVQTSKDIPFIIEAKKLMNDSSIVPEAELIGNFNFANMDRVVHRTPGFTFGLSMYSSRIASYEGNMNGENLKGWHTGDGMTYMYNNDLSQYNEDFWATVNPYRLPGTTVDTKTLSVGQGTAKTSSQAWVGGSTLSNLYGTAGMFLDSSKAYGINLKAKKSWFMFDDEIVALGADINSTDNRTIETIIDNKKLNANGANKLIVDGEEKSSQLGWCNTIVNPKWAHLEGNNADSSIGYYFPKGSNINFLREAREGSWKDINSTKSDAKIVKNYLTMWYDHGANPAAAEYSYVMLPNKTAEGVSSYSQNPDVSIVENNSEVQAVKEKKLNILAANFWNDAVKKVDYLTVDRKASVMVKENGKYVEVSVSDPTMINKGVINVELHRIGVEELLNNPAIKVTQFEPTIKFEVDVNGAKGESFTAKFLIKDTVAPTVPSNLICEEKTSESALISWAPSADNVGVAGYEIYKNDILIDRVSGSITSYMATELQQLTEYNFSIKAYDEEGNLSETSPILSIKTKDGEAPSLPTKLKHEEKENNSITIKWQPSSDNVGVEGYEIYVDNILFATTSENGCMYNVTGLEKARKYKFYIKAFDKDGNVSDASEDIIIKTKNKK